MQWASENGTNLLKHKADNSPQSSAMVNAWSYISSPPYVLKTWCLIMNRDNFTLYGRKLCVSLQRKKKLKNFLKLWGVENTWISDARHFLLFCILFL
jgi:hypothetical protein